MAGTDSKPNAHDGFVDWTFEDESHTGQLREVQARIYYDWIDYNSPDHETPEFGGYGQVADVEVLRVTYYGDDGNPIDQGQLDEEIVCQLVEENLPSIQDACTEAGSRVGAGRAHPLRVADGQSNSDLRMAPSNRQRRSSSHLAPRDVSSRGA